MHTYVRKPILGDKMQLGTVTFKQKYTRKVLGNISTK